MSRAPHRLRGPSTVVPLPFSEINEQLDRATEAERHGFTRYPGMSFEQGVHMALAWVLGLTNDRPMADE